MKKLSLFVALIPIAFAQDIAPETTVAHLNRIIEYQAVRIRSLEAQLSELQRTPQLQSEVIAGIRAMQAECAKKDAALVLDPQSGLYKPDAKGMPQCAPNPPKVVVGPAAEKKDAK